MSSSRKKQMSRFGKVITGSTIVLAILLVVVFTVPFFSGWIYLKFILICALGIANLGILYLIRV